MADWIEHRGGKQPVSDETIVQVRFPHRHPADPRPPIESTPAPARYWRTTTPYDWWRHESPNPEAHIIAYRIVEGSH